MKRCVSWQQWAKPQISIVTDMWKDADRQSTMDHNGPTKLRTYCLPFVFYLHALQFRAENQPVIWNSPLSLSSNSFQVEHVQPDIFTTLPLCVSWFTHVCDYASFSGFHLLIHCVSLLFFFWRRIIIRWVLLEPVRADWLFFFFFSCCSRAQFILRNNFLITQKVCR